MDGVVSLVIAARLIPEEIYVTRSSDKAGEPWRMFPCVVSYSVKSYLNRGELGNANIKISPNYWNHVKISLCLAEASSSQQSVSIVSH